MILLLSGKDSSPAWRLELALACISVGIEYCCVRDGRRKLGRIIIFCSVDAFLLYALRVKVVLISVYSDALTFDSLLGNGGDVEFDEKRVEGKPVSGGGMRQLSGTELHLATGACRLVEILRLV